MLSATGVSSNAFSKAAHDLARARGASARRRRLAASAGYVLTEIAKELPYYIGAAGAALVSDALTSRDALIFLAGTNVGAAIYEYALARATRVFLRQTTARRIRRGIPPPAPEGGRQRGLGSELAREDLHVVALEALDDEPGPHAAVVLVGPRPGP
jgi:hypothetical protein